MSIIVWDGKTLAADRAMSSSSESVVEDKKIWKAGVRSAVGYVGGAMHGTMLLRWFHEGAKEDEYPKVKKDETASLIYAHDGELFFTEYSGVFLKINGKYAAFGSGEHIALGAFWMGADARKAVRAAMHHSATCGFGVDAYPVGKK